MIATLFVVFAAIAWPEVAKATLWLALLVAALWFFWRMAAQLARWWVHGPKRRPTVDDIPWTEQPTISWDEHLKRFDEEMHKKREGR